MKKVFFAFALVLASAAPTFAETYTYGESATKAGNNCKTLQAKVLARGLELWLSKEAIIGQGRYDAEIKVHALCTNLQKTKAYKYNASKSSVVSCETIPYKYIECEVVATVECCIENQLPTEFPSSGVKL